MVLMNKPILIPLARNQKTANHSFSLQLITSAKNMSLDIEWHSLSCDKPFPPNFGNQGFSKTASARSRQFVLFISVGRSKFQWTARKSVDVLQMFLSSTITDIRSHMMHGR